MGRRLWAAGLVVAGLAGCGGDARPRAAASPACNPVSEDRERRLTVDLPEGWCSKGAIRFPSDIAFASFAIEKEGAGEGCLPHALGAPPPGNARLYVFEYGVRDEYPRLSARNKRRFPRGRPPGRAVLREPAGTDECFGHNRTVLWRERGRFFEARLFLRPESDVARRRELAAVFDSLAFRPGRGATLRRTSAKGDWERLADPPVQRGQAVSVWTGSELFVWGGEAYRAAARRANAAAYDPRRDAWRQLPGGPLTTRTRPAAVWTGSEVLIWGGESVGPLDDGAAFDPEPPTWRSLPPAPLSPRAPAASLWTGEELFVWGDVKRGAGARDGAAYDPATHRWRRIARAPLALNQAKAAWTGQEVIVFGSRLDGRNRSKAEHARGMAYDPAADAWRRLPASELSPQASAVAWTGRELLAWDYLLQAATYDPATDRWRHLPDLPLDQSECGPESVRLGDRVFAYFCGAPALYEPGARRWRRVALPPRGLRVGGPPVAAGGDVLLAGSELVGQPNRLVRFRP